MATQSSNSLNNSSNAKINKAFTKNLSAAYTAATSNNSYNNLTISPGTTNWSTSSFTFNDSDAFAANAYLLSFIGRYFTEEEIEKILSDIIERSNVINDNISSDIGRCIKVLVKTRHFSEDFLMKYYEYLSRGDILTLHTPDITSGAYAQLALLITNDDSKSEERDIRWN